MRQTRPTSAAESTYGRLRRFVSEPEWLLLEPLITEIERLKAERNAVILAHNYQIPVGVRDCLERLIPEIEVPQSLAEPARRAVLRMLELSAPREHRSNRGTP